MSLVKRRSLLKASEAAKLRRCSARTLKRKANDPTDDFPKPIDDNGRMLWDEREISDWIERKFKARDKQWADIRALFR